MADENAEPGAPPPEHTEKASDNKTSKAVAAPNGAVSAVKQLDRLILRLNKYVAKLSARCHPPSHLMNHQTCLHTRRPFRLPLHIQLRPLHPRLPAPQAPVAPGPRPTPPLRAFDPHHTQICAPRHHNRNRYSRGPTRRRPRSPPFKMPHNPPPPRLSPALRVATHAPRGPQTRRR